jgi:hypothetical protein
MGKPVTRIVKSTDAARSLPDLLDLVADGQEIVAIVDGRRKNGRVRGYIVRSLDTGKEI